MTLSWWITKKEIYSKTLRDINEYPGLRYHIENNHFVVSGAWPVYGGVEGKTHIEDFLIKIVFPDDYPDNLPKVYETGNKIELKNPDTHFYKDESACLFYRTERYLHFPKDKNFQLKEFLEGPVKSFFFSQLYYIEHNVWPFGQRSHDEKGLLEFYSEVLGFPCDLKNIADSLFYLLKPQIKGHWLCPCGNKKIRKCHVNNFRSLSNKLPKEAVILDIRFLENVLKEKFVEKKQALSNNIKSALPNSPSPLLRA